MKRILSAARWLNSLIENYDHWVVIYPDGRESLRFRHLSARRAASRWGGRIQYKPDAIGY